MTDNIGFPKFPTTPQEHTISKEPVSTEDESIEIANKLFSEFKKIETVKERIISGKDLTEKASVEESPEGKVGKVAHIALGHTDQTKKTTPFQHLIAEMVTTETSFAKAALPLAEIFTKHRTEFEKLTSAHGFSKAETAYLFGHTVKAAEQIAILQKELEKVKQLSDSGKDIEAMKALSQTMQTHYPAYLDALKEGAIAYKSLTSKMENLKNAKEFITAFETFLTQHGLEPSPSGINKITSRMSTFFQRPPRWSLLFGEALKNRQKLTESVPKMWANSVDITDKGIRKTKMEELETLERTLKQEMKSWENTAKLISGKNAELNDFIRDFDTITASDDLISKELLKTPKGKEAGKLWKNSFKDRSIRELNALYNTFGKELKPIYEGMVAIDRESDTKQKQAMREELTTYIKSRGTELNKMIGSLGGVEVIYSFISKANQLRSDLVQKRFSYTEKRAQLKSDTSESKALQKQEEDIEQQIIELDTVNTNLGKLTDIFNKRLQWIDKTLVDLNTYIGMEAELIEKVFIHGPVGADPLWKEALDKQGIQSRELSKFNTIFKNYMSAFAPFYLAVKNLEENPTNQELQAKLQEVKTSQFPKINKSFQAIQEWGDLPKLRKMDLAIQSYRKSLEEKLPNVPAGEKVEINRKLSLLRDLEFAKQIEENQKFIYQNL